MKRSVVFLIVVTVIVLSALYPHLMMNPGEVVEGHQKIKNECTACHKTFWGIETSRCISCHKLEEIGMKDSVKQNSDAGQKSIMFHSKLINTECTACHTEHKGVNPQIFFKQFNHEILPLSVKPNCVNCHVRPSDTLHAQLSVSCNSCHNTNNWKLAGAFNHEMITGVNKTNCNLCHRPPSDSFHQSLKDNCDKCHNTNKWSPATFEHSAYFILDEDHNVKCLTCHTENNLSAYTCYGCHEHSESNMLSKHNEEGIYNISDCVSCHRSGDEHDIRSRDGRGDKFNSKKIKETKDYINSERKKEHEKDKDKDDD